MRSACVALACLSWSVPSLEATAAGPPEITQLIDRHIVQRWREEKATPSPRCSDAEFLRRVYLDLAGVIPTAGTVREFLEDNSSDKRRLAAERLLASSMYVERFAEQWLQLLIPESRSDSQLAYVGEETRSWLRQQALHNTPYDQMVLKLLTVRLASRGSGAMAYYSTAAEPRPTGFFAAKQSAPENVAAATARIFLGLRVECAQCHDHPFADWKQDQFWSYAALFQGLNGGNSGNPLSKLAALFTQGASEVSIRVPDTDRTVAAMLLSGERPDLDSRAPRDAAAEWIASRDNPYFAKAMVNRSWAELLGRGLVDPVDDMDAANPASHPELLEQLAAAFAEEFNIRSLILGIVMSEPYQRSSVRSDDSQDDPAVFARFLARRLDAKQVHASLTTALGLPRQSYTVGMSYDVDRLEFSRYFTAAAAPLDRSSSVQQVLLMMNGRLMRTAAEPKAMIIRAILDAPGLSDSERLDTVFLSTLSRLPTDVERRRMSAYLAGGEQRERLSDILWVLLNSAEFIVNH